MIYNTQVRDFSSYDGQWERNQRTGQGKFTYWDGSIYEGYVLNSKKHGQGKLTLADGSSYEGEWQTNVK